MERRSLFESSEHVPGCPWEEQPKPELGHFTAQPVRGGLSGSVWRPPHRDSSYSVLDHGRVYMPVSMMSVDDVSEEGTKSKPSAGGITKIERQYRAFFERREPPRPKGKLNNSGPRLLRRQTLCFGPESWWRSAGTRKELRLQLRCSGPDMERAWLRTLNHTPATHPSPDEIE